ncbi:MAG TPA: protoporphyrinogen oxidase [Candidatus Baltobacteraceae bacterium]|nr:protoporphyrinogen oxidase [Candidatus Baltobacteraceae bacterium]
MSNSTNTVVVGGGISGLACAYRLKKLGVPVTLLEASPRVGGLIDTVEKNGLLFESGPQSFQGTETLLGLIHDLGLDDDLCRADPGAPRYVLRQGRLRKVPMSPQAVLVTSLLSPGTRWKIASEPFKRTQPPSEDESVADFVRRKFGHEILEYLVSPFVSGVYAGDPEKLSLRAAFPSLEEWERQYGSVLRGAIKSRSAGSGATTARKGPPPLCSFRRGLNTLMAAMGANLGEDARTGACVSAVNRSGSVGDAGYEVRVTRGGREETMVAQGVVMATPAYAASHLVGSVSLSLASVLSGIAYASLAVVGTAYHKKQAGAALDGFGVLIPRSEKYRTLGIVWNSSLFGGRAPEEQMVLTSFVGGATDPEIVTKTENEIIAIVQDEHAKILGITGAPIAAAVWKHEKALPQYNLGHGHAVEAIRQAERSLPGLYFVGNYLEGPSIGKCVEDGFATADAIQGYLGGN